MKLRQHCCHPDLLPKTSADLGDTFFPTPESQFVLCVAATRKTNFFQTTYLGASATPAEMRERLIEKLRMVLASGSDEECSVCLDSVRVPVITHCAHIYCRPCITQVISTEQVLRMWRRGKRRTNKTVFHVVRLAFRKEHAVLSAGARSRPMNWWSFHLRSWRKTRASIQENGGQAQRYQRLINSMLASLPFTDN